ncbi:MAG: hypothetical protein WC967_16010 [Balneolaceae bacterium]
MINLALRKKIVFLGCKRGKIEKCCDEIGGYFWLPDEELVEPIHCETISDALNIAFKDETEVDYIEFEHGKIEKSFEENTGFVWIPCVELCEVVHCETLLESIKAANEALIFLENC